MSETVSYEFSVGRVLGKSFTVLKRNMLVFGLMILALLAPVLFGLDYFNTLLQQMTTPENIQPLIDNIFGIFWLILIISLFIYAVFFIVIQVATNTALKGERLTLPLLVQNVVKHILPVVIIMALFIIAFYLSAIFLLIPAIIVTCLFYVAVPARVNESSGIFEAFGRSRDLTRGHRWGIFGILLVVFAMQVASSLLTGVLLSVDIIASNPHPGQLQFSWVAMIAGQVISNILFIYSFITTGVAYHELRLEKEGGDADTVARVFA